METFFTVLHLLSCVLLILVVLIQSGKGAEISATFGGSSQTVFGSSGGANFFTRFTAATAAVFVVTSMVLTWYSAQGQKSKFDTAPARESSPSAPASSTPPTQKPGQN